MSFLGKLRQQLTVFRQGAGTVNDWGNNTGTYGPVAWEIPCRTYSSRGSETLEGNAEIVTTMIDVPPDVAILPTDRVEVAGQGTYEIVGVADAGGGHHQILQGRRVV